MTQLKLTVIMKTDLQGSTPLFRSLAEDQLSELLLEQKKLISKLVLQHEGHIVKGEGDAFWITFPSVTSAVQAAVHLQHELQAQQAGKLDDNKISLRVVISAGDVLHQAHDIFGYPVNLTARIESVTPAEEIYLSQAAWLALNTAEIQTELVGEFSFKGVAQLEKVYKVAQTHRTKILPQQIIVFTDLKNFSRYQSSSVATVELLLLHLEKLMKLSCETYDGTIRSAFGDTFVLTFPAASSALEAIQLLCQQWDKFLQENDIFCPLSIGVHYGQLAVFRMFAYGEDLYLAAGFQALNDLVNPQPIQSEVMVSEQVFEMVHGTKWDTFLRPLTPDQLQKAPRLTSYNPHQLTY